MKADLVSDIAHSLLEEATSEGIALWVEGQSLRYRAPNGSFDPSFKLRLQEVREELIAMLSRPSIVRRAPQQEIPFLTFYNGLWEKIETGRLGVRFTNLQWCVEAANAQFDPSLFEQNVQRVIRKYPILSARVSANSGLPRFHVDQVVFTRWINFEELSPQRCARDALDEIMWSPFREGDPLFRPFLICCSPDHRYFGFVLNHLIGDAVTVMILGKELVTPPSLHPDNERALETDGPQYTDYVLAINEWLASPALLARVTYWRNRLSGGAHCRLHPERTVGADEWCDVGNFKFSLGVARATRTYALARHLSTTPYFVLLAAHAMALARSTAQHDLILLAMHHGRDNARMWKAIGSFQNQIPLRIRFDAGDSFEAIVSLCRDAIVSALRNQVPYHYVREILPTLGIRECFPEFNCFVLAPHSQQTTSLMNSLAELPGLDLKPVIASEFAGVNSRADDFPDHKVTLRSAERDIVGTVTYLPAEHDETSIADFVARFLEVIDAATARLPADTI